MILLWTSNPGLLFQYSCNIRRTAWSSPLIGTRENQQRSRLQQTDAQIQPTEWWIQREWFQLLVRCKWKRFNSGLSENGSRIRWLSAEELSPPPSLQTEASSADCLCCRHLAGLRGRCVLRCFALPLLRDPRVWVWVGWGQDCKHHLIPAFQHKTDGLMFI